jgi:hypothetical protein
MSWVNSSVAEIEGFKKERIEAIDAAKKTNDKGPDKSREEENNQPPQPTPEPTQQEINNASDKLSQAQKEEDIVKALNEIRDTVKNSGDQNLKKQKEEAEKKLSKEQLRQIIREEVKKELIANGIKPEELTPSIKQKVDELNNNSNNNDDQATRTEIFNEIGQISLNKLISDIEKVLKQGVIKKIENKVKELQQFINSKTDYKQNAYKIKKAKVENLLAQAQTQSTQKQENQNKFFRLHNPLM